MKKILAICILMLTITINNQAQNTDINSMTKEDVLNMSYDRLLEMPFESVLKMADIVGVSMDELYEMLLNKDVSSASKKSESSFEAPLSSTVLSSDEIVQSGARNIEEALRLVPGMILREKTNGNFDVHIRGNDNIPPDNMFIYSENTMTLVMIDGRQVYNYVNGGTFWESLPISIADIDRIEVIRGAASALYGANAATGVINIITKKPDSKKISANGSLTGGNLGTKIANINIGQTINSKFGYRVSGNYEYMERTTDKLYSLKLDSSYSVSDLFSQMDPKFPWIDLTKPEDGDGSVKYPTPGVSRDKWGANGSIYFDPNSNINTTLAFGTQHSSVLSTTFGDQASPLSTRIINTSYVDFRGKFYGLTLQTNYNFGVQDIVKGDEGFKVDNNIFNASGEYDFYIKGLNIRPGIYYQQAKYDDSDYLQAIGNGSLNGEKELSSIGGGLRLDYKIRDFRFIAGVRAEKYNVNKDIYLPFQLLATYNVNDKQLFRANYSRANRSPFLVDSYTDFTWDRSGRSFPREMKFSGSEDLKLATIDMIEIGYRIKPHKAVQIDIEAFYNKTVDYGYLSPDSIVGNFAIPLPGDEEPMAAVSGTGGTVMVPISSVGLPPAIPDYVRMAYQNIPLESKQYGVTANVDWVAAKNVIVKVFATAQITELANYSPLTTNDIIELMMGDAGEQLGNGANVIPNPNHPMGLTQTDFFVPTRLDAYPSMLAYSTNRPDSLISKEHGATPSYYGGFSVNYTPIEKLNLFASSYFYGPQEFTNQYGTYQIDPKMLLNLKVSYKVWKDNAVFINARNILNNNKTEFAWLDETQGTYLVGLDIKF